MAVRFDAEADRLTHTSNPTQGSFTWMGWVRNVVDTNTWAVIYAHVGDQYPSLNFSSDGTTLEVSDLADATPGYALSLNTWYHVCWVRTSATDNKVYVDGVLRIDDTTRNIGNGTAGLHMGNHPLGGTPFNGRLAAVKIWDNVQLTQAEIQAEMHAIRPIRTANLWGWWPMFPGSGERARDYSGNGRNLTEAGTLTDEDPPPVSWGAPVWALPFVTAGGTQYNQSASGGVTPAGAIIREGRKVAGGSLTSAGAIIRQAAKALVGTISLSGAVAGVKTARLSIGGTLTGAGALIGQGRKILSGTLTSTGILLGKGQKVLSGTMSSAGAVVRSTTRVLAGTLTSSGAVAAVKMALLSIGGMLMTAGSVVGQGRKVLSGALSSGGAAFKTTVKTFAGTLTSSGVATGIKTALISLAGTLTSSGTLIGQGQKILSGTLTGAGAIARSARKILSGTLATAGGLAKAIGKPLFGALGFLGVLASIVGGGVVRLRASVSDSDVFLSSIADELVNQATAADQGMYNAGADDSG